MNDLREEKIIDRIEIVEPGIIQVREATIIYKNNEVFARNFNRTSFEPGADLTEQPEQVRAIAKAAWTPEVLVKWQTVLHNSKRV
jgi:hypothetical protein